MEDVYDILILGGGPAGLTAALYAARYNLKVLVVASNFGGTANQAGEVENWPGQISSGMDLMNKFKSQAEQFGAEFLQSDVDHVDKCEEGFLVKVGEEFIKGKSVILALGTETRKLNVPGEKEFLGKGVSYCATCDGMFFKGKKVAVVGGADSAAKAALYLADICEKVTIVYRRAEMRCEPISLKKIQEKENIEIVYHSVPKEIRGEGLVNEFVVDVEGVEKVLEVDGVFVEIGATPIVDVVNCLGLELEKDYIITDKQMKTNVSGVFGAGDNTNNKFKQIVVAAGEGALAAKSAYDYLRFGK
jgi:thioredoxin reductase (NADPH)